MKKLQDFLAVLLCVCALIGVMMPAAPATTTLTIINLTLDAPKVENKPTATASLPSHARSAVKEVEWSGKLDGDGTFMEGVSYTFPAYGTGTTITSNWITMDGPAAGEKSAVGFSDVKTSDYFAGSVAWAVERKITSGTSKTIFSPGSTCTRGQIVTFLHRAFAK